MCRIPMGTIVHNLLPAGPAAVQDGVQVIVCFGCSVHDVQRMGESECQHCSCSLR